MAAPAQEETGDVGPSEAQFAAIMLDAKTRYKSETNVTIDDLKDVPLDIDELMEEITKRQDRFAAFRKKGKSIRNALKPFLEVINQISDGAGEGLSLVPSPDAGIAKPILKAISFLITAAKDVEKSYDYIVDLFDNLNNMLERYKIYVSHDVPIPIRTNMVKTLAHMLVIFGNATKAIKTGRGLQFIKVLIGQNGAVAKSLEKLENLIKQEHSLVSATILSISTDIFGEVANQKGDSSGLDVEWKKTVKQILIRICDAAEKFGDNSSTVEDIRSAVIQYSDELQTVKNAQTRQTLIAWLDAPDMSQNHKQARDKHTKDTGVWLLDSSQFKEWKDGTVSTLYLMGKPGCGKSVLCSTIINRLRYTVIREGQSSAALAYHYFDFRHPAQQSCESLLLSLCRQLLDYSPEIPAALERLHQKTLGRKDFSLDELQSTFHDMLPSFEHVYIVVDALDECASDLESGRVTQFLKSLLESAMSGVHIVLTSRPTGSIHNAIAEDVSRGHRIDLGINVEVRRDIARYIQSSLYGDKAHTRFKVLHTTDLATIEKKLVHDADGMFRWAFCQLEALQKCGTPAKLLEALKTLPRTLDETYERTLMAIPEDDRAYAKRILLWLAFSLRPLTINEAAETMTLTLHFDDMSQRPHFSDQERPFSSSYVLETCSSLVDISVDYPNGIVTVHLAHASVKEYLIQSRIRDSYFFLDADLAHEILAHACLVYLTSAHEHDGFCLEPYAATYWMTHLSRVAKPNNTLCDAILEINEHTEMLGSWVWHWRMRRDFAYREQPTPTLLYCATVHGAQFVVQHVLENGADVNAPGGYFGSPLQAALYKGHKDIALLLLAKGANIHSQCGRYGNALQAASYTGYEDIVHTFLRSGVEINRKAGFYGTALQAAADGGSMGVVQLLLDNGASINTECGRYGNALQAAAYHGHIAIVQLLIDNRAEINTQGGIYSNALQAASATNHQDVVTLLLKSGANVNRRGGRYGTALQAASHHGHREIVELLLANHAEVNDQGQEFGSSLQAAIRGGHKDIVEYLLEKGADVNAHGGKYANALQAASCGSQIHSMLMALDIDEEPDEDIDPGYRDFSTVLHEALHRHIEELRRAKQSGRDPHGNDLSNISRSREPIELACHKEIIRLLLARGASINAQGGFYGSALQAASFYGHESIVKELLEKGAQINLNVEGSQYGTALQAAARFGSISIVELLLDKAAEVNIEGGKYGTALQAASTGGHMRVVQLLLNKKASPGAPCGHYGNPLQAASHGGHKEIVQLLLEMGVNVNAQGGIYGNAFYAALDRGRKEVVKILLKNGYNVDAHIGSNWGTSLQSASYYGMDDIVQLLLDKGASVNAEGGDYGTALQAASSGGHITIIHLLIKYGADINLQSGKYGSALSAALYKNNRAVVQLLRESGAKLVTSDKNELPCDTSVLSASRLSFAPSISEDVDD